MNDDAFKVVILSCIILIYSGYIRKPHSKVFLNFTYKEYILDVLSDSYV